MIDADRRIKALIGRRCISVTAMSAAGAALIVHCAQIMLGVLKVVLGRDDVAALGLGSSQIQVAVIISLRI
jgi:hypothetical protein